MKSLKEITAKRLAVSERVLSPKEASMVIAVIKSMRGETSDYDVDDDNKLKHWRKETEGLVTREYINGKILKEIGMYRNGNKEYEDWFDPQGNYHRERTGKESGPARSFWDEDGVKVYEMWYKHGKINREDGPADTHWYENGQKEFEFWYKNGKWHREGSKPARTGWYQNGNKEYEEWWINGVYHREGSEPAVKYWYENGEEWYEAWYENGNLQRMV